MFFWTYANGCDLIFKECNDYENGNALVVKFDLSAVVFLTAVVLTKEEAREQNTPSRMHR